VQLEILIFQPRMGRFNGLATKLANIFTKRTFTPMVLKRFVNYSTVSLIVCANAQIHLRDVSQLTRHSSHHQAEYSYGGGLLEV